MCDESSLSQPITLIQTVAQMRPSDGVRFLFNHYRTSRPDAQDAFVLALIGEVVCANIRHVTEARPFSKEDGR